MKNREGERGASAVEFALILPILILLIFGIVEFGRAYQVQTTVSAAAREGARSLALGESPAEARAAVKNFDPTIAILDSEIDPLPSCPSPGATPSVTTNVKVTVHHKHPFLTGFFGKSVTLTGKGTMRCEG